MPNPNPNGNFDQRPFAGSAWATNQDAGIALANQRRAQGLPPPWYREPTPEQRRRARVRKIIRHWIGATRWAVLSVLFMVAAASLVGSRPASALAGFGGGIALALLSMRSARRARHARREID